jgi:hypothetical protein
VNGLSLLTRISRNTAYMERAREWIDKYGHGRELLVGCGNPFCYRLRMGGNQVKHTLKIDRFKPADRRPIFTMACSCGLSVRLGSYTEAENAGITHLRFSALNEVREPDAPLARTLTPPDDSAHV